MQFFINNLFFIFFRPILWIQVYIPDHPFHDGNTYPVCLTEISNPWAQSYMWGSVFLFYFFPLFLLIGLYWRIRKQLLADVNNLTETYRKNQPQMKSRRQVAVMLATVVVFFFVCLLPWRMFFIFIISVPTSVINDLGLEPYYNILYGVRVMFYLNSCINPILYNMTSTKFRKGFLKLLFGSSYVRNRGYDSSNSYFQYNMNLGHISHSRHLNNSFSFTTNTTFSSPTLIPISSSRLRHQPSSLSITSVTSHRIPRNTSIPFNSRYSSISDSVV